MTWFAVDDSFHGHPKLADLEAGGRFAEALSLWTVAGSWCADHLTDGRVPAAQLRKLVPFNPSRAADELARVGMWDRVDGGFQFHDWGHYQPLRNEVEERRQNSAARTRKSRQQAKSRVTVDVTNAERDVLETLSRPVPSRPVPSPERESVRTYLVTRFQKRWEAVKKAAWPGTKGDPNWDLLAKCLVATSELRGCTPESLADQKLAGWFADPWVIANKYPTENFARYPEKHIGDPSGPAPVDPSDPVAIAEAAFNAAADAAHAALMAQADAETQSALGRAEESARLAFRAAKAKAGRA